MQVSGACVRSIKCLTVQKAGCASGNSLMFDAIAPSPPPSVCFSGSRRAVYVRRRYLFRPYRQMQYAMILEPDWASIYNKLVSRDVSEV